MIIRKMALEDCPAIAGLVKAELGYPDINQDTLRHRMAVMESDGHYAGFVAVDDGDVVGFIGLRRSVTFEIEGEYVQVIAMAVRSDRQGRSIGKSLLCQAEQHAIKQGARLIALNSGLQRTRAHLFYERNGYVKKGYSLKKTI